MVPPLGAMCTCIRGEHLELRGFTKGLHGNPLGCYVYMYKGGALRLKEGEVLPRDYMVPPPLGCYVYMYKGGALRTERFYQGITWYPPLGVCVHV